MLRKIKINLTPNKVAIIASIMALIGLYLFSYNYLAVKKTMAYDYIAGNIFDNSSDTNEDSDRVYVEFDDGNASEETIVEEEITNDFIGYLEIPKIGVNKGFLHIQALENDVEKNIYVVPGSDYPDKENGNVIIAGHSGTGWKAFFNDLYKLNKNDQAIIRYKGYVYTYKVVDIYKEPKIGKVKIKRDHNKNTLTLITCTNNDSTTQTIYILEVISSAQE